MLMMPDLYYNASCAIQCLWNARLGHPKSVPECHWQSHTVIFGITSNAWMNALVAKQIHSMLVHTKACRHYEPPHRIRVIQQCCMAYVFALFLSFLPLVPKIPFKTGLILGVGCLPLQYDGLSSLFLYVVYFPLAVGIPMLYVVWIAYDIFRRDLIPPVFGRAKHLLFFFARIVLVYIFCWSPSIIFTLPFQARPAVRLAFSDLAHLQGSITAACALLKPDVWEAFTSVFPVCCCGGHDFSRTSGSHKDSFSRRHQLDTSRPETSSHL